MRFRLKITVEINISIPHKKFLLLLNLFALILVINSFLNVTLLLFYLSFWFSVIILRYFLIGIDLWWNLLFLLRRLVFPLIDSGLPFDNLLVSHPFVSFMRLMPVSIILKENIIVVFLIVHVNRNIQIFY